MYSVILYSSSNHHQGSILCYSPAQRILSQTFFFFSASCLEAQEKIKICRAHPHRCGYVAWFRTILVRMKLSSFYKDFLRLTVVSTPVSACLFFSCRGCGRRTTTSSRPADTPSPETTVSFRCTRKGRTSGSFRSKASRQATTGLTSVRYIPHAFRFAMEPTLSDVTVLLSLQNSAVFYITRL